MSDTISNHTKQRRHERIEAEVSVRISTIEPERDPWTGRPFFRSLQETCANVSRGGAFVKTAEPLDPGRRVLLEITLPNGRPLETLGRIAWVKRTLSSSSREKQSGIGIEFLGGAAEQFQSLEDFIARKSDDEASTGG